MRCKMYMIPTFICCCNRMFRPRVFELESGDEVPNVQLSSFSFQHSVESSVSLGRGKVTLKHHSTANCGISNSLQMNFGAGSVNGDNPDIIHSLTLQSARLSDVPSNHLAQKHDSNGFCGAAHGNRSSASSVSPGASTSHSVGGNSSQPNNTVNSGISSTSSPLKQLKYNWQASKVNVRERLSCMFNNEALADVQFVVGKGSMLQIIPAHKFVLSIGSSVFDAMFNGAMATNTKEIELPDIEPAAFLALLKFLYSDEVEIGPETVMTTLYTAKKYAVPSLEKACVEFLKENLSSDNAFMLLTQARLFDEPQLAAMCLETIDKSTSEAISAEGFTDIDLDTLCVVLERDSLHIREDKLYKAVVKWSEHECVRKNLTVDPENQRLVLGRSLSLIRFPLMSMEDFANGPAQSKILTDAEICSVFVHNHSNPKITCQFVNSPRCSMVGKEQTVCRFQQSETRWGYSGTSDRIRFSVDRRIFVIGFGLYGSIHGSNEYDVAIQIIHTGTGKTLGSHDTGFTCDGSNSTFRVLFREPIEIQPNTSYTACATLRGQDSHYGTKGLRKVLADCPGVGKVTFQFTYAAGNNNGTSIEDGQIPEIIFYI